MSCIGKSIVGRDPGRSGAGRGRSSFDPHNGPHKRDFIFEVVVVSLSFSLKQKYYSFSLFYIKIHNLLNIILAISLLFKEKEKTGEFLPDFPTKIYGFSVLKTNSINIHSKVSNLVLIENLTICLTQLQHFVENQFKLLGT